MESNRTVDSAESGTPQNLDGVYVIPIPRSEINWGFSEPGWALRNDWHGCTGVERLAYLMRAVHDERRCEYHAEMLVIGREGDASKYNADVLRADQRLFGDAPSTSGSKPVNLRRPISRGLARRVWDRDDWTCVTCGGHSKLTVDHINPVVRGGTNDFDNLQTMCASCNSSKGARV